MNCSVHDIRVNMKQITFFDLNSISQYSFEVLESKAKETKVQLKFPEFISTFVSQ